MTELGKPSVLVCAGCGWVTADDDPYPFRCANRESGDDVDHVLAQVLDPRGVAWPSGNEANPFVRYRDLFHSHQLARAHGMRDAEYVEVVERLDKAIAAVDGSGFEVTPLFRSEPLGERLGFAGDGGVWVKDETANVSGSHKARHLMGIAIQLAVVDRLGLAPGVSGPSLAIASCGNAALAAAVVARAAERPLEVFVPTWADQVIVRRLQDIEALITTCPREEGIAGDPTYHRLQDAIRGGSIPFTCQGPDNGLSIEGGKTIGYEVASQAAGITVHRLFVQVGGGALASAVIQGLQEAHRLGALGAMPRIQTIQTKGGYPLERAYRLVVARILDRLEAEGTITPGALDDDGAKANLIRQRAHEPAVDEELAYAARHRSQFMWPWEEEPKSVAHGILDDETYDWLAVVRGMVATGGYPLVVSEDELIEANELARRTTGVDVDPTGSAGLAGLIQMRHQGEVASNERVLVLFTGKRRDT